MKAGPRKTVLLPKDIWIETWEGLRSRGRGVVESAAVWGGSRNGVEATVRRVYFLDDLYGPVQRRGYHKVAPEELAKLFAVLHANRDVIVGDIHTHPTSWVGLSALDKENPIEFRRGLMALVLPEFAMGEPSIAKAGVHEYLGDREWRTLEHQEVSTVFQIC